MTRRIQTEETAQLKLSFLLLSWISWNKENAANGILMSSASLDVWSSHVLSNINALRSLALTSHNASVMLCQVRRDERRTENDNFSSVFSPCFLERCFRFMRDWKYPTSSSLFPSIALLSGSFWRNFWTLSLKLFKFVQIKETSFSTFVSVTRSLASGVKH